MDSGDNLPVAKIYGHIWGSEAMGFKLYDIQRFYPSFLIL